MSDKRLLPDWLSNYIELTSELEAKEQLHLWTGLCLLSSVVRRRIYLDMKYGHVFPNMYVIIVAESGKARKSTAIDFGHDLLMEALPDINVMYDSMTSQALVASLNHTTTDSKKNEKMVSDVTIFADEIANLFSYDRTRAAFMTIFLTRTYTCPAVYGDNTIKRGKLKLQNLYPVVIGATDPRNLKVFPPEAVTGLTGRLIWIIESERRKNDPGWKEENSPITTRQTLLREMLITDLSHIATLEGVMTATNDCKEFYDDWYADLSKRNTKDPDTDAFYHRCHVTALRIGILLSISESDELILTLPHMKRAIDLIEAQPAMAKRAAVWSGSGEYEVQRAKAIDFLQKSGGLTTQKKLLKYMGVTVDDYAKIIATLVHDGTIEKPSNPIGGEIAITLTKEGFGRTVTLPEEKK